VRLTAALCAAPGCGARGPVRELAVDLLSVVMTTRFGAISAARRDISPATVAILVAVALAIVAVVVVDEAMMTTIGGPNLLEDQDRDHVAVVELVIDARVIVDRDLVRFHAVENQVMSTTVSEMELIRKPLYLLTGITMDYKFLQF